MSTLRILAGETITSWICPPRESSTEDIQGWVKKLIQNYQFSLSQSSNYKKLQRSIQVLSEYNEGETIEDKKNDRLSALSFNRTKRQMTELVAILSDIKPSGDFKVGDKDLYDQAEILTNLYKALWQHPHTQVRKKLIQLFQYALTGEGYLRVAWEGDPFYHRNPSLSFEALSIDDVAFSQLPRDKDIQKAYATVIRHELPIAMACMLYPDYAESFSPSNATPTWLKKVKNMTNKIFSSEALNISYESAMQAHGFPHSQSPPTSESTIDVYEIYIMDFSINKSGHTVPMGKSGTSEYYEVPSLGSQIPTKFNNPLTKQPIMREALRKDCLLYPNRRRIICTDSVIISDGPSPWAHGLVPIARFALNDWVWDRVGDPMAMEGQPLNQTIEMLYKGFHDMLERKIRPSLKMPNTLSNHVVESYDPRVPGRHLKVDPLNNTTISPVVPPEMNVIQGTDLEYIAKLEQQCDYIIGKPEMRALAEAQQIPSSETFEKILEMNGPMTKFVALNVEAPLMEIGEMVKSLLMQFATAGARYEILGKGGLSKQDFDYDPATLVPKDDDDDQDDIFPTTTLARIRQHQKKFSYRIMPGAAYNLIDVQRQMIILQLWRDPKNFPIDPWTVDEYFHLNIGPPPDGCKTMIERWAWWQKESAKLGSDIQSQAMIQATQTQMALQQMQQEAQAQQLGPAAAAIAQSGQSTLEGGGDTILPSTRPEGRPPSGQEPPRLEQKSDGRQTITES